MSLALLLRTVATELDLPDLKLNSDGVCQLTVEGRLTLSIEDAPLEHSAHFYTVLIRAPDAGREEFFASLLDAQLFGREIGEGISFGFDRATGEILLCRKLTVAQLTPEAFSQALTEFINWAEHWQEKLSRQEPSAGSFSTAPVQEHFIRA